MNKLKLKFSKSSNKIIFGKSCKNCSTLSANFIRQTFIDYFLNENHTYIKSSTVRPFNDPSLEFVNAGMNQFKNVFLGYEAIPAPRAVNSQKCIRVGGKHNDLNAVGMDTYHHTFFEMLGNWSFNDYFKKDACKLAWHLITTKPYALDVNRLYVTYFKGDENLNLPPDLETKELWEEIGVPKGRILPFGLKENFWEMGLKGPCGPCTEIHYDHLGTFSRPHLVNKDSSDLTELWNNVFIQFNRLGDGSLVPLEKHFVDTGMGLERLVALLQGKSSNYDTDIFTPYFDAISKISGFEQYSGKFGEADVKGFDTAYRILADHSRMVSVAIADNVFPEESHGLRRVIRKGLIMSEKFSPGDGVSLMIELSKIAAESFSQVFPEVSKNLRQIEFILRDENELWQEVKSKVKAEWNDILRDNPHLESLSDVQSSGLISSFKELKRRKIPLNSSIPEDLCLMMYDRHGLNPRVIEELARVSGYSVDIPKLENNISALREKNKSLIYSMHHLDLPRTTAEYITNNFCPTDDSFKAKYFKDPKDDEYCFEKLKVKVNAIVINGSCVPVVSSLMNSEDSVGILLDKTNFWSSIKGNGDCGEIQLCDEMNKKMGKIYVDKVVNLGGYVYHIGKAHMITESLNIPVNSLSGEILVNYKTRLDLMRNTSAAHLLSLALQETFICNIQSYRFTGQEFTASFSIYGHQFEDTDIKAVEDRINSLISEQLDIEINQKSTADFIGTEDLYLPPYINQSMKFINFVRVNQKEGNSFREVTVGPNVLNTKDIGQVCLLNFETRNRGRNLTISGLSGEKVVTAISDVKAAIFSLENKEIDSKNKLAMLNSFMMEKPIPFELRKMFLSKQLELKSEMKQKQKNEKVSFVEKVIQEAKEKGKGYVVLYVGKETRLEKLVQLSTELPIMLFACNGNYFSARCYVPKDLSILRPGEWMEKVAKKLGSQGIVSKVQDSTVYLMKPIKVEKSEVKNIVEMSEKIAVEEADLLLFKNEGEF